MPSPRLWPFCHSLNVLFVQCCIQQLKYPMIKSQRHLIRVLTHWGRVTHICISELTIIGSDNGLLPGQCQAIIWNNVGLLLPLGKNFSEISIGIQTFSFKKMHLNMLSAKWRPFLTHMNSKLNRAQLQYFQLRTFVMDPSHKSLNVLYKYPTMHHFVTEMCTHVYISITKWCIVGYGTQGSH